MTTKIWRGDAPAVAQVTRLTPATVEIGDTFTVTINGKSITVTATAATVANVVSLLVTAIENSTIAEFQEITATEEGSPGTAILLTANTAGVPFVATGSASNGGASGLSITTTVGGGAAASEVQTWTIPGDLSGSWKVSFGGQVASPALDATGPAVTAALEALSTIGAGNIVVTRTYSGVSNNSVYVATFQGALANTAVALLVVTMQNAKPIINVVTQGSPLGGGVNEVVSVLFPSNGVSAYTFNLTFAGETSANRNYTSGMTTILGPADWPATTYPVVTYKGANLYEIEFSVFAGAADVGAVTSSATWLAAQSRFDVVVTATTEGQAAGSEVQVVTLTTAPTGGTFTLTYSGQTTSAIAYNASAATVDAALEALSNIGAGDVVVTGSAGGPWTVTFATALAGINVDQMTGNGSGLTGGTVETFAVAAVTASAGPNHWDTAANWLPVGVPITGDDVRFEIGNSDCSFGIDQTGVTLASLRIAMTWTGKLGLPRKNSNGYLEYRPIELTCGITSCLVGYGDGSGPGKVALNTLAVQTAVEVRGSGGSSDVGIPAVTWRGSHASNVVTILDGEFGTAPYSDQSATMYDFLQRGGSVALKNTAVTNQAIYTRQSLSTYNCTLGGKVWDA